MNNYEEVYNKLRETYSDAEIAEGYMIPETLTDEEAQVEAEAFRKMRFEMLSKRTDEQRMLSEVTRLRIKINEYLKEGVFLESKSFGNILDEYIRILNRSRKVFAEEIDLHYTKLSRIINGKEVPSISLIYRLEQHTAELIPAIYWWKLLTRQQEQAIQADKEQRKIEQKRVKNKLRLGM